MLWWWRLLVTFTIFSFYSTFAANTDLLIFAGTRYWTPLFNKTQVRFLHLQISHCQGQRPGYFFCLLNLGQASYHCITIFFFFFNADCNFALPAHRHGWTVKAPQGRVLLHFCWLFRHISSQKYHPFLPKHLHFKNSHFQKNMCFQIQKKPAVTACACN